MTPFTDEDLKRLKEREMPMIEAYDRWLIKADKINALLARLEAAEKMIGLECHCNAFEFCEMHQLLNAWRKAAGRE